MTDLDLLEVNSFALVAHFKSFWLEKTGEARDWKIEHMILFFRFGVGVCFFVFFQFAPVFAGSVQGMQHR